MKKIIMEAGAIILAVILVSSFFSSGGTLDTEAGNVGTEITSQISSLTSGN